MIFQVVERTKQFLDDLGLIDEYQARFHRWYDDDVNGNTAIVLFRKTGDGVSDVFKQEYDVTITLLASDATKIIDVGNDAQAIVQAIRGTGSTSGVVKFQMLGNQQGPFYLENDRPLYQINVRVFTVDQ